jgi:hypothetical protein
LAQPGPLYGLTKIFASRQQNHVIRVYVGDCKLPVDITTRLEDDSRALMISVQSELRAVDPTIAIENLKTLEVIRSDSQAPRSFAMP